MPIHTLLDAKIWDDFKGQTMHHLIYKQTAHKEAYLFYLLLWFIGFYKEGTHQGSGHKRGSAEHQDG